MFMRGSIHNFFISRNLNHNAIMIQKNWRGFLGRKKYRIILEVNNYLLLIILSNQDKNLFMSNFLNFKYK